MRLYNTLTRREEDFAPSADGTVRMYTCGLTVYARGHIGNFRTFVATDVLRRALRHQEGYPMRHVMNYTDVDDRTILESQKAGVPLREYTGRFITAFLEDAALLGLEPVEETPRATDEANIEAMGETIRALDRNGHTYASEGSIYFKISTLPEYGKLAHLDHAGIQSGARIDSDKYEKENARDFVLWKATKPGEPTWDPGIGPGRPGWHIECSAMALRLLGEPPIDIHSGGVDLIFPHHENEIAQAEGATGKPFVRFWFHVEHLMIEDDEHGTEKMSKSLGNVFNLADIVERGFRPSALRYLYLGTHYRKQLKFSWTAMRQAEEALKRITDFLARVETLPASNGWRAGAGWRGIEHGGEGVRRPYRRGPQYGRGARDHVRPRPRAQQRDRCGGTDGGRRGRGAHDLRHVRPRSRRALAAPGRGRASARAGGRDRTAHRGAQGGAARQEFLGSRPYPAGPRRPGHPAGRHGIGNTVEEEVAAIMNAPDIKTALPGPKAKAIIDKDTKFVSPSYTRDYPFVIAHGQGAVVEDVDGNRFLDCAAGIAVNSTGVSHPDVVKAITEQAQKFIHMSGTDFYYEPQVRLAEELASLVPIGGDVRTFFANSGTETTEAAIKMTRYATKRQGIIAFLGAFHGRSMGALSLTASKALQRRGFAPFMPGVFHAPYPDTYRFKGSADECAEASISYIRDQIMVHLISPDEIAAIVVEPVQGEGGYLVPPKAFLQGLRALTSEHGIAFVCDEVQSGMGRTGKMFALEHFGVKADVVNIAKGIASGLPLGITCAKADIMAWPPGAHASTFGGNPVSCAAALATIKLLKEQYVANAAAVGAHLLDGLRALQEKHAIIGDIRGMGLMIGVELVKDRTTKERAIEERNALVQAMFRRGVLILGAGRNAVRFAPPLVLSKDQADSILSVFDESLSEVTGSR